MIENRLYQRRLALQLAAQLPDSMEESLAILEQTMELVRFMFESELALPAE